MWLLGVKKEDAKRGNKGEHGAGRQKGNRGAGVGTTISANVERLRKKRRGRGKINAITKDAPEKMFQDSIPQRGAEIVRDTAEGKCGLFFTGPQST